jgi:hypothetical protein
MGLGAEGTAGQQQQQDLSIMHAAPERWHVATRMLMNHKSCQYTNVLVSSA